MSLVAHALTTRQRLIDFLQLGTTTATEQTVLDVVINTTTSFIESYTGRRFKKTTYTNVQIDSEGANTLMLPQYPVDSAATFTLQLRESSANEDEWSTVDSEDYFIDYDGGVIHHAGHAKFVRGKKQYRVTYTAGFDFNNTTTFLADTEAGDVEYAVYKIAAAMYLSRNVDPNVMSERLGDYAVTYGKSGLLEGFGMDRSSVNIVIAILNLYKRADDVIFGALSQDTVW